MSVLDRGRSLEVGGGEGERGGGGVSRLKRRRAHDGWWSALPTLPKRPHTVH